MRIKVDAVYTMGVSMGGYAAIVYGHHLKAENVLAFSPQLFLDRQARTLIKCNTYQYEDELFEIETWAKGNRMGKYMRIPDIADHLQSQECQIHIGGNEKEDVAQAEEFQKRCAFDVEIGQVRIFIWPGGNHLVAKQLRDEGKLNGVLKKVLPNGPPPPKGPLCAVCAKPAKTKCGKCKDFWLCGTDCQRKSWPEHKKVCGK